MKKTLLTILAIIGLQVASKAQALEIVNNRKCAIMVNVNVNGGCFGTGTCDLPSGGVVAVMVPGSTTLTFPTLGTVPGGAGYGCAPATYEYVRAGIQNHECDECSGAGVTVGEPCTIITGFGPTCYTGTDCSAGFCADFTRPWGPGSARITVW
jgi:hypothetical protein